MKTVFLMALVFVVMMTMTNRDGLAAEEASEESAKPQAAEGQALNHEIKTIQGKKVNLAEKYKGKVVMVVNVASKCGYTPQYEQLQALHEKYSKKGLAIVGIPCNQFGGQEPGKEEEIVEFCKSKYGVEFDMMAKVDVNGPEATPLYKYLTSKKTDPKFAGEIKWNFEKFVFDREGNVIARFSSRAKPDSKEVVEVVEAELAKKAKKS